MQSVYTTGLDAWLIIFNRSCRMLAYGASSLILALFFAELKFSDYQIGLFMSLTLCGDVVLGLLLTLVADRVGRRRTLMAGSLLMIMSGATFALRQRPLARNIGIPEAAAQVHASGAEIVALHAEAPRHFAQQLVADAPSQRVVDQLEAVEVDEHQAAELAASL